MYWDATLENRLVARTSEDGAIAWLYAAPIGKGKNSISDKWIELSGRGSIDALTLLHRPLTPEFGSHPYYLAIIALDEGPRMMSRIILEGQERIPKIGDTVAVVFSQGASVKIPIFKLVK
ncbi:MAG: OB-fold domain-containing protein [Pseudomonadales bacterium]